MEFGILGPLDVHAHGRVVALGGAKPRALLAVLLLHANQSVSAGRLALALWGEDAPAGAVKTVQVHVSRLRKALGDPGVLTTDAAGYRLRVRPGELDAARFEELVAEGRARLADGRADEAAAVLREALALWRGPPLSDVAALPFAPPEITRLEEQRLAAVEARVEADLAAGRHAELVAELRRLTGEHPWRERLAAQRMLALYRCGRQAEALEVYRETRARLAGELGLEPGEELRRLEQDMLAQAPRLEPPRPATTAAPGADPPATPAAAPQARRVVTVVFAALTGAERLDAESLHALLDRCAAVVERHGGSVETVTGDTLVGLFGAERAQEDDAVRAVRAALELRDAAGELQVGVESGEVFVGAGARRRAFATGEAVTVATALGEAAAPGEVLLGDRTRHLAGPAVHVEPAGQAWRLVELGTGDARPLSGSPFVGRERELAALRAAIDEAAIEQRCRLVTVVGGPGIGKSRLVRELIAGLDGTARAVVGRCAAYGEGSTFAALAEIVRELAADGTRGAGLVAALGGDEAAAAKILAAVGLADAPAKPEEISWAVRRLLERAAHDRPLVVAFEDIHWAGPGLLDLLEYVAAFSTGAPVVLLCLARPELFESRPSWAAPQPNRSELVLEPLSPAEAGELVAGLGGGELQPGAADRIVGAAEGNPLFVEQLVAVPPGAEAVPLSLRSVLAARIDRLDPGERAVLGHGSVEGRTFHAAAVAELLPEPERAALGGHLVSLVRKQLLRAERSELEGEDAFRFGHVLIRDAAYEALPKRQRAELHERLADWLAPRARPADEVVGHHLEQACRHHADLGDRRPELARAAADRLAAAARAASMRGDTRAAAVLLERATALGPPGDPARVALLAQLGSALYEARRLDEAGAVLEEAVERAEALGRADLLARARVEREVVRLWVDLGPAPTDPRQVAEEALEVLARHGDDVGQCRAWSLLGWIDWGEGRVACADEAWGRAADHARRAGDDRELVDALQWSASAAAYGPMPVDEAIRHCDAIREQWRASPVAAASTLHPLAVLHAMRGDTETAWRMIGEAKAILDELGRIQSAVSHHEAGAALLAGRPDLAEAHLRKGYETLRAMGERGTLATTSAMLADAVYDQGRSDEADELCATTAAMAAPDDLVTQVIWRRVRAKVLAGRGDHDAAATLAREALELLERTDLLCEHGDALLDLAEVEALAGRHAEAEAAARRALELYERKGNVVSAGWARARLASARDDPTTEVDGAAALAVRQAGDAPG